MRVGYCGRTSDGGLLVTLDRETLDVITSALTFRARSARGVKAHAKGAVRASWSKIERDADAVRSDLEHWKERA